jgi:hypothetical protein
MPVQLIFRSPEGERAVTLDRPIVVGRDAACEVSIASVRLSRRHAEFSVGSDGVTVRDLGSKNGILVNGAAVDQAVLKPGDRVLLGDVSVSLIAKETTAAWRTTTPVAVLGAAASVSDPGRVVPAAPPLVPSEPVDLDRTSRLPSAAPAGDVALPTAVPLGPVPLSAAAPPIAARSGFGARFGLHARVILLGGAAGVVVYLASVWPGAVATGAAAEREAETRATTIVRLLAAENRSALASDQPLAATVRPAMQEPGVRAAMIIAPEGRVLAPPERLDTTVGALSGLGSVETIRDLRLARVDGEVHAAIGIDAGNRTVGVAWLAFDPEYATENERALLLVRLASAAAAVAVGWGTAALMWRMLARRLAAFGEDLDLAVAGRQAALTQRYGIPALARAIEAINFLVERQPSVVPALQTPLVSHGAPNQGQLQGTVASGTVTLDSSFVVRAVDPAAASLLGATPEMLVGRHVLEAANRLVVDVIIDCLGDLSSMASASRDATGPVARVTASRSSATGPITLTLDARREV